MARLKLLIVAAALALAVGGAAPRASAPTGMALLQRYAAGDFAGVSAELAVVRDFTDIYKDLKSHAPAWIQAGGAGDRARRTVAAATFALEASRAGEMTDWKFVQNFIRLENIYWRPPAELLEWGCALMRQDAPRPIEQTWQLAALAVADRAQDFEFLIGSPWEGRANPKDEILLAQGIAAEWRLFPSARRPGFREAQQIFEHLRDSRTVGAEATMRLGVTQLRAGSLTAAAPLLDRADQLSRDPYVTFLARYFKGQLLERQRRPADAETAYRAALDAVPRAQSATFSLAAILAGRGARAEAASLIDASLSQKPRPADPWRTYADADDRFWPGLIETLRAEIIK